MPKIITEHVYPPIPIRRFDWLAYYDGMEDGLTGTGATEAEAVADLIDNNDARWIFCGATLPSHHKNKKPAPWR